MRFAKRLPFACVILSLPTWASAHEEHQHTAVTPKNSGPFTFPSRAAPKRGCFWQSDNKQWRRQ